MNLNQTSKNLERKIQNYRLYQKIEKVNNYPQILLSNFNRKTKKYLNYKKKI